MSPITEYDAIPPARRALRPESLDRPSLLARKGYRVLVVDKATFPSDHDLDAP